MSVPAPMNNNDELMGILPVQLSTEIFRLGYASASKLHLECKTASPRPTYTEAQNWLKSERSNMKAQAISLLRSSVPEGMEDDEWEPFDWAAAHLAEEGFQSFFREMGR